MGYETVLYEVKEGVGRITLNRPEAYNALNLTLGRELFQLVADRIADTVEDHVEDRPGPGQ